MNRLAFSLFLLRSFGSAPRTTVQAFFPQVIALGIFDKTSLGSIYLLQTVIAAIIIYVFPKLTIVFSLRFLIISGVIGTLAALISTVFANEPLVFIAGFGILGGLGWALHSLRGPQEIVNYLPRDAWPSAMSASASGPILFSLFGPSFALLISHFVNWQAGLLAIAMLCLISGLVAMGLLHEYFSVASQNEASSEPENAIKEANTSISVFFLLPAFFMMAISGLLNGTTVHFINYLSEAGFSENILSVWSFIFGLTALVAVKFWTSKIDGEAFNFYLVSCILLVAVTGSCSVFVSDPVLKGGLLLGWLTFMPVPYLRGMFFLRDLSVTERARYSGYLILLQMLFAGVGVYLAGVVGEKLSYQSLFPFLIALSLLFGSIYFLSRPPIKEEAEA